MTAPSKKPRTLVVDDSPTILHAICSLLEHHGVVEVVGRAESGRVVIDTIPELRPDWVLMDADMPEMSGLRMALLLSQIWPATRVILMSMETGCHLQTAGARCGAYAVIYKPKFLNELTSLLKEDDRSRVAGETKHKASHEPCTQIL